MTTKFLEHLMNDNEQITIDIREKMMNKDIKIDYENVSKLYEDWKYLKNDDLEAQFFEINDYRTSMRGLKVRGVYDTHKEASTRAQVLRRKDPSFNVFVGQIGYWLPWDPECESVPEQEYQESQLNDLVKKYKENLNSRDDLYEQVKNERIEKAKKEVNAKKELLKAQNEQAIPEINTDESVKNIEQLRSIVDESDKLYYDNLKNAEQGGEQLEEQTEVPSVEQTEVPSVEQTDLNNFKAEKMESLEEEDPWLLRKKEQ